VAPTGRATQEPIVWGGYDEKRVRVAARWSGGVAMDDSEPMDTATLFQAARSHVIALDGGLATELEAQGCDLSGSLWSARLLAEQPEQIYAAHRAFFAAGAQVAITASYQASFAGFAAAGIGHDRAVELMRRSVELARRAAVDEPGDGPRWVAASVGPYGATLGDGSEYRGDYGLTVADLRRFHRERLGVLADAGADVLAVETIPSVAEVEAVVAELDALGVAAWISLTAAGRLTRAGEPAADAFALAATGRSVGAIGVNCTRPADVSGLLELAAAVTDKPLLAYPNSGEDWDAAGRQWHVRPDLARDGIGPGDVETWIALGARLVGGCCRVTPSQISAIARTTSADRA
jgi:homocysteine S-methyltransferase